MANKQPPSQDSKENSTSAHKASVVVTPKQSETGKASAKTETPPIAAAKTTPKEESTSSSPNTASSQTQQKTDSTQTEKENVSPEPNAATDGQREVIDNLRKDTKRLITELTELEVKTRRIQNRFVIDDDEPTSDYSFAKEVIDNDIRGLELVFKGLKNLVISIQDRQEKIYSELTGVDKDTKENLDKLSKNLDSESDRLSKQTENKVGTLKDDLTKLVTTTKTELNTSITHTKGDLKDNISSLEKELRETINKTDGELRDALREREVDIRDTVSGIQNESRDSAATIQSDIRGLEEKVNRLFLDLEGLGTKADSNYNQLQTQIPNTIKKEVDQLRTEMTQAINKVSTDLQALRSNKEACLRTLAAYVNKLAQSTGKDRELTRYGLDNSMRKLESTGSV